jgi:hypothetical protein
VQSADGSGAREALVTLEELHALHETHLGVIPEIASAVLFGEVPAVIAESGEADHLDRVDRERLDIDNLHL